MTGSSSSFHTLMRDRGDEQPRLSPPPARWLLRFALPVAIVLIALALLGYAARDALMPSIDVDVVPVVMKQASAGAGGPADSQQPIANSQSVVIAQAPGWIEPDPYPITVPSLAYGVIKDVLVLEGVRIEEGQVIARLIDEDAQLALRRALAEMLELEAATERAGADVLAAEARLAEIQDEVERKRDLVQAGGISPGEYARLEHRLRSMEGETAAARAALAQANAAIARQQVNIAEAELALDRTVIRAPIAGVVLSRSVVPGTRIAMAGDGVGEQHFPGVVRLYDPANLQVRADVPLADAAKVGLGTKARITTEALPDRVFDGEVTRIVHQADIQRNSIQVKVRIDEPSPLLKPDMLARVRFLGAEMTREGAEARSGNEREGSLLLFAPERAIINRDGERAQVWTIEPAATGRAHIALLRDITLGERDDEFIHIRSGLNAGQRIIVSSSKELSPNARVRIRDSTSEGAARVVH